MEGGMIVYHALRGVGDRIEEIRVTRLPFAQGGTYKNAIEEHVAFFPRTKAGERAALASMRAANTVRA